MNEWGIKNMNETFVKWLASRSEKPCCFQENGNSYILLRAEKNQDFEYLFYQKHYHRRGLERDTAFKYAGIYCRKDGLLYDVADDIIFMEEDRKPLVERSAWSLKCYLKEAVCKKVEAIIDNNRDNLQITEIVNDKLLSELDYVRNYSAKEDARRYYLSAKDFNPLVFQCDYEPERWKNDSLLAYILDPENYIQQEATQYIADNQENMLYNFLENDAV